MRRISILLYLGFLVFLAGCVQKSPITEMYKNDVITIENYQVSTVSPYSNSTTTIELELQNNADGNVSYAEINFFDMPGFTIKNLNCGIFGMKENNKCIFKNENSIESLDSRRIVLELTAPSVTSPTAYTLSFSVKYSRTGIREAMIPIIDDITIKTPTSKFSQSQATYGPVLLNIQPSLEKEIKVGDKTVKEYWGTVDRVFETRFKFSHVDTIKEKVREVNIPAGNVILELTNLRQEEGYCNFEKIKENTYRSKIDVLVPVDFLICNFNPLEVRNQPEYPAVIKASYSYTYEFIKTETFVVQPVVR